MKKHLIIFSVLLGFIAGFIGCQPFIENKIIVQNKAADNVQLILAGKTYDILANETRVIPDIRKGTFQYSTIYDIPDGITQYSAEGDVAGSIVFNAGTEILLVYTSVTDGETYTLFGLLTSSDDVNRTDPFVEE